MVRQPAALLGALAGLAVFDLLAPHLLSDPGTGVAIAGLALISIPLARKHRILAQVAGHGSHTVKLLPALVINDEDCEWIERAFDDVIADSHKVPGAIWSLGKTLVDNAVRRSA